MIPEQQKEALSLDILAESLNLGMGHVIEELAEISGSRIELHVPEVNMITKQQALAFTDLNHRGSSKCQLLTVQDGMFLQPLK